jgi:hypothetical protein
MDYSGWPDEQRFEELDREIRKLPPDPDDRRYRRKPAEAGNINSKDDMQVQS